MMEADERCVRGHYCVTNVRCVCGKKVWEDREHAESVKNGNWFLGEGLMVLWIVLLFQASKMSLLPMNRLSSALLLSSPFVDPDLDSPNSFIAVSRNIDKNQSGTQTKRKSDVGIHNFAINALSMNTSPKSPHHIIPANPLLRLCIHP